MKLTNLFFPVLAGVIFSCGTSNNDSTESAAMVVEGAIENVESVALDTISENYLLFKGQCLICHGGAPSHDELIAPPMVAVQRRYKMQFDNKEEFVEGMVAWSLNPKAESALMRGAVKEFNVMPKPVTVEEDLKTIAAFIYDNELEQPEWFDEHFNQMHPNGMGGKGMGNGQGMKKEQN